jgi:hypothetical protein
LICLQGVALGVVPWHWRCVRAGAKCFVLYVLRTTVPLASGSRRGRVVLAPPAARAVFPDLRFSCAGLDLLWPRRSSVASPVESESSASSNRRTAMQGREDRETRNSGLLACNISCLGQKCRDVRARALTDRDTCRVEDRMDKSMNVPW